MATRNIMRIDLTAPAKQKVERLSDHYGMTQLTIMSRLVEWMAKQNPETQKAVLFEKSGEQLAATQSLRRLADEA